MRESYSRGASQERIEAHAINSTMVQKFPLHQLMVWKGSSYMPGIFLPQ
jgi:hypothetical protein